jgi:hydrogenase maturation protein HypF
LVDATNSQAVVRLRARKGRRGKPLAVMVESLAAAKRLALLDDAECRALADPAGPIVLVRSRGDSKLSASIHPGLDTVGLMLPTTPLHWLLLRKVGRPLVCTSGNREGDPLDYNVAAAEERLRDICDLFLHHDRPIERAIHDSVVRVIAGNVVTIRLARGLAPLPLDLPGAPSTLAVGGHLKGAAAWSNGAQAVLGPHIGDLEGLAARERFVSQIADWQALYRFEPEQLVCDMHPDYFTTEWAAVEQPRVRQVQHHHAHVVAGMLEHGWLDRTVLGTAWDGTGFGTDRTIWGGEFLICTARSFERFARLRPFRLPGGEAAIHQPWRVALSILRDVLDRDDLMRTGAIAAGEALRREMLKIIDLPQFSPLTTSAGRLFDAAAALILGAERADFDGQRAMQLEAAADRGATGHYEFPLREGKILELDWRPLVAGILVDRERGVPPAVMAMRFHRSMAEGIVAVCCRRSKLPLVLGGGVFQNRLLTELVSELWTNGSRPLGLPGLIPPNDGGLAAGQLAVVHALGR